MWAWLVHVYIYVFLYIHIYVKVDSGNYHYLQVNVEPSKIQKFIAQVCVKLLYVETPSLSKLKSLIISAHGEVS